MSASPPSLSALRDKVKDLDDRIMRLLAERLSVAREIGQVKADASLPIKDYKVEKEVIERSRAKARELGLYEAMAEEVSRLLIKYAVLAQDEFQKTRKRRTNTPARRVLIAGGRGRMGRWLSEYFDSFGHAVSHFDPMASDPGPSPYPLETNLSDAAMRHDIVVLSAPISTTAALLDAIPAATPGKGPLVFDICSLKTPLLGALERAADRGIRVASAHPMFGPSVDLLAGRNILICHVRDEAVTKETRALFEATTANLVDVPVAKHDELMSYVLGLSHLVNLVFAEVLRSSGLSYGALSRAASTTFNAQLDVVRPVAHENQELYYEIQAENRHTAELVAKFQKGLDAYAQVIAARSRDDFRKLMDAGRTYLDKQGVD